jgi:hypothetical protein
MMKKILIGIFFLMVFGSISYYFYEENSDIKTMRVYVQGGAEDLNYKEDPPKYSNFVLVARAVHKVNNSEHWETNPRYRIVTLTVNNKVRQELYFDLRKLGFISDYRSPGYQGVFAIELKYFSDLEKVQLWEGDKLIKEVKIENMAD